MDYFLFFVVLIFSFLLNNNNGQHFEVKLNRKPLKVVWNVPSFQCDPFKMNFSQMLDKYDIVQNKGARFRGENIVILYDPGNFPAILKKGQETFYRNGGVPQEGNLTDHMQIYADILEELIPDKNFSGLGIIDFESWRPIYRQNWGTLQPYKNYSEDIERQKYPLWPETWIKKEATRRFEEAAKKFMKNTLLLSQNLRPYASWGYYHYPYCFNYAGDRCSKEVMDENDRLPWLFNQSDSFYPSLYLQEAQTVALHAEIIEGRVNEALRIKKELKSNQKIYAYYWYKYQDTRNYLSKEDLFVTLTVLASRDIDGIILWGASADVNSKAKCLEVYDYIDKVFGPIVRHV